MSKNWYPVINYDTCTSCGNCFDYCCNGVYKLEKEKVIVGSPEKCVEGCKGCQPKCPTESISHFGDDGSKKESSCDSGCSCSGGCC